MIDLLHGDCLELLKGIPAGSVDLILTDPPYGMMLKPQRNSGKFSGVTIRNDDNLSWAPKFFDECFRVTKNDTASLFFCSHHCVGDFVSAAKTSGYEIKNLLVWDKGHFGMGGNWRPVHELVLVCTKGRFVTHSNNLKNIISFKKVHHSKASHPTQKPVDLLQHLILEPDYNPRLILDPFMGSGSTGVACVNLDRDFIGIELDDGYFEIAKGRIAEAQGSKALSEVSSKQLNAKRSVSNV